MMKRFVEGEDRRQGVLLPEFLDDYVGEDNPVAPEVTGRPAYHPATLLKIYLAGDRRVCRRAGFAGAGLFWCFYYNGDEVLACEGTGILPVIPKTQTSGNAKRGLFTVADFIYDAENDRYTCPAGERLTKGKVRSDRRDNIDHYRNLTACLTCALKPRCTPDKVKRLKRWEHESVLDKMQARLDHMPEARTIRRQTVEHPFGTLKAWMGSTHFLTRTLEKVKTEMSLQVLAYNMKRMINIFGVNPLMQAIAA